MENKRKYNKSKDLPILYISETLKNLTVEEYILYIESELNRRLSIIKSEPNGINRETMIDNLLIDLL